jgi:hypothetical protein
MQAPSLTWWVMTVVQHTQLLPRQVAFATGLGEGCTDWQDAGNVGHLFAVGVNTMLPSTTASPMPAAAFSFQLLTVVLPSGRLHPSHWMSRSLIQIFLKIRDFECCIAFLSALNRRRVV